VTTVKSALRIAAPAKDAPLHIRFAGGTALLASAARLVAVETCALALPRA